MFDFLCDKGNDTLSKMNEKDKKELLELLKQYKISLKDKLNLDENITFGLELEFNTPKSQDIGSNLKTLNYRWLMEKRLRGAFWDLKRETSSYNGYEVISPILVDNEENYRQLSEICNMLKEYNVLITEKDAGHIHIGTQIIGNDIDAWLNFFRLYTLYENIIYRFSYGEFENKRPALNCYAPSLASKYSKRLEEIDNKYDYTYLITIRQLFNIMKTTYKAAALNYYKVNQGGTSFEVGRTIEFRMPNASIEPIIWQNNINFLTHFLKAAKKDIDPELIMRKIKDKEESLSDYSYYNDINVDEALEVADLIFDNNRDKIDFLRQYMKDFIPCNEYIKSKEFIKK